LGIRETDQKYNLKNDKKKIKGNIPDGFHVTPPTFLPSAAYSAQKKWWRQSFAVVEAKHFGISVRNKIR
jgi:hypothetical protein